MYFLSIFFYFFQALKVMDTDKLKVSSADDDCVGDFDRDLPAQLH